MIFLDINTFFCAKGGGIRTYHLAKLEYFKKHPEHTYYLVYPGESKKRIENAENVIAYEAFGFTTGRGADGYRILFDYLSVYKLIREVRPDVIEAGDPWFTGLFCIFAPLGNKIIRSSFFHSDPVNTYFLPWASSSGTFRNVRVSAAGLAGKLFYYLQKKYRYTLVSSDSMLKELSNNGIDNGVCTPFGVDEVFFRTGRSQSYGNEKLLYAGRLDGEKGVDLLIHAVPKLLEDKKVSLSVAGRGKYSDYFKHYTGRGLTYLGYIESKEKLAEIYAEHDIFLFPGQYETFGLGALEAMAAGMVVVGPDKGGTGELLRSMESEFIFSAGDSESFLDKIRLALTCDFKKESSKSRSAAHDYGTWDQAVRRMIDFYKSVV